MLNRIESLLSLDFEPSFSDIKSPLDHVDPAPFSYDLAAELFRESQQKTVSSNSIPMGSFNFFALHTPPSASPSLLKDISPEPPLLTKETRDRAHALARFQYKKAHHKTLYNFKKKDRTHDRCNFTGARNIFSAPIELSVPTSFLTDLAFETIIKGADRKTHALERYRFKKLNHRTLFNFEKKIEYKCRKTFADTRERVGGRFVKVHRI